MTVIGPNLFFPCLVLFSYLTYALSFVLFHVIYIFYIHILYVALLEFFFFY